MKKSSTAAFLLVAFAGAIYSYTLKGAWPGYVAGWRLNNPGFNDTMSGTVAQQNAAIQNAAATWGAQGCSRFSFNFQGSTNVSNVDPNDGVQAVIVRDAVSPSGALASTTVWRSGRTHTHFDMVFWDGALIGVPGNGAVMSGGGVTVGNIVGVGLDMALTSVDNWNQGNDYWRIAVGTNCDRGPCIWSGPQGVDAGAAVMSSTAVASADFNANGRRDLFLSGVDNWDGGLDYWRYRVGVDCTAQGVCTWSPVRAVEAGGAAMSGGGVAIGDLDAIGGQEIIIFGIDNWDGGDDYWRYRVCSAPDTSDGKCDWTRIQTVAATGNLPSNLCGADTGTYISNNAVTLTGGGVTIADVTPGSPPEVVVAAIEPFGALDFWRYVVGSRINVSTGAGTWAPATITSSGGDSLTGGGVATIDINHDGRQELLLSGVDDWGGGLDYWRVRLRANPCGP